METHQPFQPIGEDARRQLHEALDLAATDPKAALAVLAAIELHGLRRTDPETSGRVHYLRARLLAEQGDFQAALGSIRSARRDWLTAGLELEATRTDLGRSTILVELGEYEEAIRVCERLLTRLDTFPAHDHAVRVTRAGAYGNLGNARNLTGDYTGALRDYDVAANLFQAMGERVEHALMDANRAIACLRIGLVHRGVDELRRSATRLAGLDQTLPAAKCTIDLAEGLLLLGQPLMALASLEEIVDGLSRMNAFPELARLRLARSFALLQLGQYSAAHDEAMLARETFTELTMDPETARTLKAIGWASLERGDLRSAQEDLGQAARIFEMASDPGSEAGVWLLQARLMDQMGDRDMARGRAHQALELLEKAGITGHHKVHVHLLLAELCDDLDAAADHLESAAGLIDQLMLEPLRLSLELGRARNLRRRDDNLAAVTVLTRVLANQHGTLSRVGRFLSNTSQGNLLRAMSDELIRSLLADETPSRRVQAWQAAAVVKTGTHEDLRRFADDDLQGNLPRAGLITLSHMYEDLHTTPVTAGWPAMGRMIIDQQRLLARQSLIRQSWTSGIGFEQTTAAPRVPEITMAQFHVLDRDIALFVLREGGVSTRILPGAGARASDLIRAWTLECARMRALGPASATERTTDEVRRLMAAFHELLVAPMEDLLEGHEGEPLMMSLDQHLIAAPWEAFDDGAGPLSARYSLYFCTGLDGRGSQPPPPRGVGLALFAVPDEGTPAIGEEAAAILRLVPDAEVHLGAGATTEALRAGVRGRDIVHISCHGEYQAEHPLYSAIRLHDRWLTGCEILGMDFSGALVIIGACESGRSAEDGAEPIGIAWALLCAGARAVVVAKWVVDDAASSSFLVSLHAHLAAGLPDRLAVDRAREEVARAFSHPYHWSAFRYICSASTALLEETTR